MNLNASDIMFLPAHIQLNTMLYMTKNADIIIDGKKMYSLYCRLGNRNFFAM